MGMKPIGVGPRTIVRYEGVFDHEGLYKLMFKWFKDRDYDFIEKAYKRGTADFGRKEEFEWIGKLKYNDYIQFQIDVQVIFFSMQKAEVMKNGKKVKMNKGRIEMKFKGQMNTDYQKKFVGTKFLRKLNEFYERIVYYNKIGDIADVLYYQIFRLQTEVREHLNMSSKGNAY
jgi:hypothetical protein